MINGVGIGISYSKIPTNSSKFVQLAQLMILKKFIRVH